MLRGGSRSTAADATWIVRGETKPVFDDFRSVGVSKTVAKARAHGHRFHSDIHADGLGVRRARRGVERARRVRREQRRRRVRSVREGKVVRARRVERLADAGRDLCRNQPLGRPAHEIAAS